MHAHTWIYLYMGMCVHILQINKLSIPKFVKIKLYHSFHESWLLPYCSNWIGFMFDWISVCQNIDSSISLAFQFSRPFFYHISRLYNLYYFQVFFYHSCCNDNIAVACARNWIFLAMLSLFNWLKKPPSSFFTHFT